MISIIFISLLKALINKFKDWFNQCLVVLSFLFVHVFNIVKQSNQAFNSLTSNYLILVLKIFNEEGIECWIEWL